MCKTHFDVDKFLLFLFFLFFLFDHMQCNLVVMIACFAFALLVCVCVCVCVCTLVRAYMCVY